MASYSIQTREKADGTKRHKCLVRVKSQGRVVYSEARTFTKHTVAKQWGKKRVLEIEENGYATSPPITLFELIQKYIDDPDIKIGRTKGYVLKLLQDCDIAQIMTDKLTPFHVIEHCKNRRESGTSPATINHDVSYLRAVLRIAKTTWGIDVSQDVVVEALPALHKMKLIGRSTRRTRRPTSVELERLKAEMEKREQHRGSKIPYVDILDFSILTCMRIGEVCSIRWDDVNEEQKAILSRDRKDPRKKEGNHMLVPLLGGAWEILNKQPKVKDRIFPYNSTSVTRGYQRVRNKLGIKDLKYHDMRREGASRLFEKGYQIHEVAQVTGHRDLNILWQVYTELFPDQLHQKELIKKPPVRG